VVTEQALSLEREEELALVAALPQRTQVYGHFMDLARLLYYLD